MIKYFRFDYDYVLWEIGFANLNMLLITIPTYEPEENNKEEEEGHHVEGVDQLKHIFN